ncbi:secretion protein HlyD, partial [Sphingomonas sp. LH128]
RPRPRRSRPRIEPMKTLIHAAALALALMLGACSSAPQDSEVHAREEGRGEGTGHESGGHEEGTVSLSAEQLKTAGVEVMTVGAAGVGGAVSLSATIEADPQGIQIVTAAIGGRLVTLGRNLGDAVQAGETLAVVESREAAQMQGEIEAASARLSLANSNLARERRLFAEKVSAEQDLVAARTAAVEAAIALRLARQQLAGGGGPAPPPPRRCPMWTRARKPLSRKSRWPPPPTSIRWWRRHGRLSARLNGAALPRWRESGCCTSWPMRWKPTCRASPRWRRSIPASPSALSRLWTFPPRFPGCAPMRAGRRSWRGGQAPCPQRRATITSIRGVSRSALLRRSRRGISLWCWRCGRLPRPWQGAAPSS